MFSIGEFARHGRVSVRMLRHYDAIGLLRPASVDAATGYRFYQAGQLAELNRIIALKDLGFTLQQVQAILAEQVSAAELRGMLKLRRAEIHAQIEAETARLTRVETRLATIEDEARIPVDGVVIKRAGAGPGGGAERHRGGVRAGGHLPGHPAAVPRPVAADGRLGVSAAGPAIAYYEDTPAGDGAIVVHAAVPVVADSGGEHGFRVVDLAEVASAAAIIHHGSMDDVLATGQALARWIDASGYRSVGYAREITLEWSEDPDQWVTELQQPIEMGQP